MRRPGFHRRQIKLFYNQDEKFCVYLSRSMRHVERIQGVVLGIL